MSFSVDKLNLKQYLDPRLVVEGHDSYVVTRGPQQTDVRMFNAPSASQNGAQITIDFPDPHRSMMDKRLWVEVPVKFTFTSNEGTQPLRPYYDAPRSFPLSHIIHNLQTQIGDGVNVSIALDEVIDPLLRLQQKTKKNNYVSSLTPTMLDNSVDYSNLLNTVGSPLALYGDHSHDEVPRGAFIMSIENNDGNPSVTTVNALFREEVMLSPFNFGHFEDEEAIYGINKIVLNINFANNLYYLWSHVAGSDPAGYVMSQPVLGIVNVYTIFMTPPTLLVLKKHEDYSLSFVQSSINGQRNVNAGQTFTASSGNLSLNTIPDTVIVCARRSRNSISLAGAAAATYSDSYLSCGSNVDLTVGGTDTGALSVTFGNQSQIFSNYTNEQLFEMSVRNGLNMNYESWSGLPYLTGANLVQYAGVGSIIVFKSTDLNLADGLAAGVNGSFSMNINYKATNNSANALEAELCIITISNGKMVIDNGHTYTVFAPLSQDDVLKARNAPLVKHQVTYGGNFFSSVLSGFKKVAPVLKTVLNHGPTAAKAIESLGFGKKRGKGRSGGAKVSKRSLKLRLHGAGFDGEESESEEEQEEQEYIY